MTDSLIDIAQSVKWVDPLRAGLLALCWEDGACEIEVAVTRNIVGHPPERTLISHGCSGFMILSPAEPDMAETIQLWLDSEHSPLEAFA